MPEIRPVAITSPWRNTMGLGMRTEAAKFALTAFNLNLPSGDERGCAERFAGFLKAEAIANLGAAHGRFIVRPEMRPFAGVSVCRFAENGELSGVFPALGPSPPDAVIPALIAAFNQTRLLPGKSRPRELARLVHASVPRNCEEAASRLLASTCLSFEPAREVSAERFVPPDFASRRGFGGSPMTAVFRWAPDGSGADLWLNCHHSVLDGAPVQELLERLEASLGVAGPVVLPPASTPPLIRNCHLPGEREAAVAVMFPDLSPLVELRRRLAADGRPAPLAALLIWSLSHEPEFSGIGISTAVDLPADESRPRAVDLAAVWPHRYRGSGILPFLRDAHATYAKARERKSMSWRAMSMLSLLPSPLGRLVMLDDGGTRRKFGTMAVSILRGSRMFVPPFPDRAWDQGFVGIGEIGVAAENGPAVTPVSIKTTPATAASHAAALRRAIAYCQERA